MTHTMTRILSTMDKINMTEFHDETASDIFIINCVFGDKALDCRGGEINGSYFSLWEPVKVTKIHPDGFDGFIWMDLVNHVIS
jgi:hypothetical protein